jgi:hypothetical protein
MVVPRSLSARTAALVPLAPALVALLALVAPAAVAQASPVVDNANLDLQRPLRLEDALPVAEDTVILETGVQFVDEHQDTNHVVVPFRAVWGAAPHLQLEAGTYVASDPHDIKGQSRPGDVQLGALYNFVQETKDRPALSGKATVNVPSGGDSNGFDFGVEGLVTKSFDQLSLHANAGLTFLAGEPDNDRTSRWDAVVGASHPVDWFEGTPTTFIATSTSRSRARSTATSWWASRWARGTSWTARPCWTSASATTSTGRRASATTPGSRWASASASGPEGPRRPRGQRARGRLVRSLLPRPLEALVRLRQLASLASASRRSPAPAPRCAPPPARRDPHPGRRGWSRTARSSRCTCPAAPAGPPAPAACP